MKEFHDRKNMEEFLEEESKKGVMFEHMLDGIDKAFKGDLEEGSVRVSEFKLGSKSKINIMKFFELHWILFSISFPPVAALSLSVVLPFDSKFNIYSWIFVMITGFIAGLGKVLMLDEILIKKKRKELEIMSKGEFIEEKKFKKLVYSSLDLSNLLISDSSQISMSEKVVPKSFSVTTSDGRIKVINSLDIFEHLILGFIEIKEYKQRDLFTISIDNRINVIRNIELFNNKNLYLESSTVISEISKSIGMYGFSNFVGGYRNENNLDSIAENYLKFLEEKGLIKYKESNFSNESSLGLDKNFLDKIIWTVSQNTKSALSYYSNKKEQVKVRVKDYQEAVYQQLRISGMNKIQVDETLKEIKGIEEEIVKLIQVSKELSFQEEIALLNNMKRDLSGI